MKLFLKVIIQVNFEFSLKIDDDDDKFDQS